MLFRALRRRRLRRLPFPEEWLRILRSRMPQWSQLTDPERATMQERIRFFIAERYWEGCAGQEITDEVQVVVAAYASLLVLARPKDEYKGVSTVLVYPSGYFAPDQTPSVFGGTRLVSARPSAVLGQAHQRGPVILSWQHAIHDAIHPHDGRNLVLHEFAHKLDMLAGPVNGTPPMDSREQASEWREVMQEEMNQLRTDLRLGMPTPLRAYAATNPAEFFAVITEVFFEQPEDLQERKPDLYAVLRRFYRQDPAARALPTAPKLRPEP